MSSASIASPDRRLFRLPALRLIVLIQAAIHLAVLPAGGFIGDTRLLQSWATTLVKHPVSQFYAREKRADHLPGDLWIIKLEAWAYHLISGHLPANAGFLNALKLGPGVADIGIAVILYLIAREINGGRAGRRAALFFALNPAPIFISMVWGVADSVSMLFAAAALLLVIQGRFWASAPVLAYACLIKPQLGVLAPLILIFFLRAAWERVGPRRLLRPAVELCIAGAASLAVLLATILPFDVGIPLASARWSLIERIRFSANLYDRTTMNALNLWAFVSASAVPFPSIKAPSDQTAGLLGITYQGWGVLLTAAACLILILPLIRHGGKERLIFTSMAVLFAVFTLQSRMHERYFFPAVALMAAVAALRTRWIWLYLAMSSMYAFNVGVVYRWLHPSNTAFERATIAGKTSTSRISGTITDNEIRVLAAVNLGLLAVFLVRALLDLRKPVQVPAPAVEDAEPALPQPLANFSAWP